MKSVATIKVKIRPNQLLFKTMGQYSKAVQYIADKGFESGVHNRYKLHHLCYYEAKKLFQLPSQFVINANRVASQTLKSAKTNKGSKPTFRSTIPLAFDKRTFTFSSDKIRLTTIKGRVDIPINVPKYYWKYLDWSYQTALLIVDKKQRWFLHITFSRDTKTRQDSNSLRLGVDIGINNLAVCSDGKVFKGHKTRIMQHSYLRKRLQRKGTKSAKRKLKALSGRQKRYMRWVNHNISKQIVGSADCIVLEDLKGIRKQRKSKRFNRWLHNWSFYQLQQFIKYKAEFQGKMIVFVNPYMTSQTCSNCLKGGSRYLHSFVCNSCGFSSHADFNASCNLRRLPVTQPNVPDDDVKSQLATATEFRDKSPCL